MTDDSTIPLAKLPANGRAVIRSFAGGHAVINRLASLGFTPGAMVNMTQNYGHGPIIVTVRGTRVALGRGEAGKIFVEPGME